MSEAAPAGDGLVLVCGLGAFGQAVVCRLLPFAIPLRLIDQREPDWRTPELRQTLHQVLTLGDMRRPHVLRSAGADQARAVLLLSSDGGTNIEAALQVRLLNETAEIVIRASDDLESLGSLLQQRLPRLTVVNPLQLSVGALVQALRPGPQLARFAANGETFEVRDCPLQDQRFQKIVRMDGEGKSLVVMPLEFFAPQMQHPQASTGPFRGLCQRVGLSITALVRRLLVWLRTRSRLQQCLAAGVLLMALSGVRLFASRGGWVEGVFVTAALLKGEYVDPTNVVLGNGGGPYANDAVLVGLTLGYSLVGTLLSSALVAVILDQLLMTRLGVRRSSRLPRLAQPILLIGGDALAAKVAAILQRERLLVVRVDAQEERSQGQSTTLVLPSRARAEKRLRGRQVRAVALLSGELLTDLQDMLQLQNLWPEARFALLARSEGTEERLGHLLGEASLISPVELGADVAVATAFGELVEGVWRIQGQNLLQVRYRVSPGDGLIHRTVSRLEHGYGLTVLSLLRQREAHPLTMPSPGTLLEEGDELVAMACLAALRRAEQGQMRAEKWRLRLQWSAPLSAELRMIVQQTLVRHLGMTPTQAAAWIGGSPPLLLAADPDSGALVVRDLRHQGLRVELEPVFSERPREPGGQQGGIPPHGPTGAHGNAPAQPAPH
jgi:Trk K+ transport system NAD-binding subunit